MSQPQKDKCLASRYTGIIKYALDNRAYFPLWGKRIGYIGWLGHGNLGDEAMYQAVCKAFDPARVIPYQRVRGAKKLEKLCQKQIFQTVLLGGGTLINELTYFDLLNEAQSLGYATAIFGAGVRNPQFWDTVSKNLNHISYWIPLLERCSFVGIRGPISKEILAEYGFNKAEVIGDPALLWALPTITPKKMTKKLGINIGISPEKMWAKEEDVLAFIVKFVRNMIDRGWEITFFPMWDGDIPYIHEAVRQIGRPISVSNTLWSVEETLRHIQSCDLFIGQKLHSVILACCTYTPSIMLEYRPKCRDFMASLDLEQYNLRIDSLDMEQLIPMCDDLYSQTSSMQQYLHERVIGYRNRLVDFAKRLMPG